MTDSTHPVISPKKLIEVAMPLDAINKEGAQRKRKAPRGYPTAIHKWWAQRPVASARGILLGQLLNDPESVWRLRNPQEKPSHQQRAAWTREKNRLFKLIESAILGITPMMRFSSIECAKKSSDHGMM